MSISLRDTTPDDEAFLLDVYASTRASELELTPWTDEQKNAFVEMQFKAQDAHYHEQFPDAHYKVIVEGDQQVGRVYWANLTEQLQIIDITVLPEYRNRGIGTPLIKQLLERAAAQGKPARIYVESFNPSLRLFERLGFNCIEADGFLLLLEWRAEKQR